MSQDELLLHGLENSDAIIVGRVSQANQEIVERIPGRDDDHFLLSYALIEVEEVLFEGRTPLQGTVPISIAADRVERFQEYAKSGHSLGLFLRAFDNEQLARTERHGRLRFEYVNIALPLIPGQGVIEVERQQLSELRARVRNAVARSEPAALAREADLVVRGRSEQTGGVCQGIDATQMCTSIRVSKVLYGEEANGIISVYSTAPGYVTNREAVFFLRRTAEGPYETIGLSAGARSINKELVGRRRTPWPEFSRKMAAAEHERRKKIGR